MKEITITITETHLEKALSKPWSTCSCLIAVAMPEELYCCARGAGRSYKQRYTFPPSFIGLMDLFDSAYHAGSTQPPNAAVIETVRAQLPLTDVVEVEETNE